MLFKEVVITRRKRTSLLLIIRRAKKNLELKILKQIARGGCLGYGKASHPRMIRNKILDGVYLGVV
jgi:hypothetical protein